MPLLHGRYLISPHGTDFLPYLIHLFARYVHSSASEIRKRSTTLAVTHQFTAVRLHSLDLDESACSARPRSRTVLIALCAGGYREEVSVLDDRHAICRAIIAAENLMQVTAKTLTCAIVRHARRLKKVQEKCRTPKADNLH